jgi:DNA-3-methyladenine glycosylase II
LYWTDRCEIVVYRFDIQIPGAESVLNEMSIETFDKYNLKPICDRLATLNSNLHQMINTYGYPKLWQRERGFAGLVRIILEQQVSLSSAFAVYKKLIKTTGRITPESISSLSDEDFKICGFSRQKKRYVKILAQQVLENGLDIASLDHKTDRKVREILLEITGIGDWTCDVYLLMCLNRLDIFPIGDIALIKSMKENGLVRRSDSKQEIIKIVNEFRPFRSVLAMILWHGYIEKRGINPDSVSVM